MEISNKQITIKFLKYYLIFFLIAYIYMISDFYLKYASLLDKDFPGWFYFNFLIFNSCWISILISIYVTIPSCLFTCKDYTFLINGKENIVNTLSVFTFLKPIFITSILLSLLLFLCMNYLLPDSNYQARTYIQHLKMSENFDDSILERIQKSNYRSDREMDISAIVAELNHIEAQIKKIDQNESMKNRDLIQKHLIEKERQARIKLFNFFKIPVYLISLILIALPIGIIIRRLNKALIGLVSLGLVILFYVLFLEFETILENVNYPIIFLFTPEFLFSLTGIILLFYFNKIYILYNKKG